MKRTLATLAAMVALTAATHTPAVADTPRRVTPREYVRVEAGWSKAHAHRVLDVKGTWVAGESGEWMRRQYPAGCAGCMSAVVFVTYRRQDDGDWVVRRMSDGRTHKSWCDLGCVHG